MRARTPDREGTVERGGVGVHWELHGEGSPTVLFLPAWSIVHSRVWKAQIPWLARRFRVVAFDPRGNGRSDRPADPAAYAEDEFAADALAVMDATDTERAAIVGLSLGGQRGLILAAEHPERILGAAFVAPSVPLAPPHAERDVHSFDERLDTDEGWAKYNAWFWRERYGEFLEFFFASIYPEPHSTKPIEDGVRWGLETDPETLIATHRGPGLDEARVRELAARVRCPVLVLHGDRDAITPLTRGAAMAEATGGRLVVMEGSGHCPQARDPVRVSLLLREFLDSLPDAAPEAPEPRAWTRARIRPRRVLFVSSPIGLGHARRDLAIARALRERVPDLQVDWLAQHPVTAVLAAEGERIHPASALLASESRHIEMESGEHELAVFEAIRRMDEIFVANFMVFLDVVRAEPYDAWVGDEAWEIDHFLHENPELKTAPWVWLSDFVGWLPMPEGGEREAFLTADYNAEMIEQIERYPWVRDRALFVGEPEDVVPAAFGPGLPSIRDWTAEHFDFVGYETGFDPAEIADRDAIRRELGWSPADPVCVVAVGGSGVGESLLRRAVAAAPEARRRVPGLRMVVVAGPRIDPAGLPAGEGVEIHSYVHRLHRWLAACDVAVVQGGLTTTMELTAAGRPFVYLPLARHFEQNLHVRHRLERHGAGRRMDFASAPPARIAEAIAGEIDHPPKTRPVAAGSAVRAAERIAELI